MGRGTSMEDLPPPILLEILSRLTDSAELACCRLACRDLRSLSPAVPAVRVRCSCDRFLRSRTAAADRPVPFKSLVANLAAFLAPAAALDSVALAVDRPPPDLCDDDEGFDDDDADDLHLTAVDFLSRWLPLLAGRLRSLSISDYWIQSCWRRSEALALISDLCTNLVKLEVRNSWLSVSGLKLMPKLTNLSLEFIRLDDEDLNKVNECFPSLQVLNLIGVGGFKEPKIHLPQLRICHWRVSNIPSSLTICAPKLTELELRCVEPELIVLDAPLLSILDLAISKPTGSIKFEKFLNLRHLKLESLDINALTRVFMGNQSVKNLEVERASGISDDVSRGVIKVNDLPGIFANVDELKLGPRAWIDLHKCYYHQHAGAGCQRFIKKLMVHLPSLDFDAAFMSFVLNTCAPTCVVAVLFDADSTPVTRKHFISKCISGFPKVRWRWVVWNESSMETYLDL